MDKIASASRKTDGSRTGYDIYITANSPGEMSGWVAPVLTAFRRLNAETRITVVLTPCPYASGREEAFAGSIGVHRVVPLGRLLKEALFRRGQAGDDGSRRCVLFLGGDAFFAVLLAKLLRAPAFAYAFKPRWPEHFVKIFVPEEKDFLQAQSRGIDPSRLEVVGPLALDTVQEFDRRDAAAIRSAVGLAADAAPVFSLFAGSRPNGIEHFLTFLLAAARLLTADFPSGRVLLPVSPFVDRPIITGLLAGSGEPWREEDNGTRITLGEDRRIAFVFGKTQEAIASSDVIVTLPGTNNLQIAAHGVPLIVIVPLNWVRHIPLDGLVGRILDIGCPPFPALKEKLIHWMNKRTPWVSILNTMSGRMLVPEIRAVLQPEDVAAAAAALWRDPDRRRQMTRELLRLTSRRGAAKKIAETILAYLAGQAPPAAGIEPGRPKESKARGADG